MKTKILLISLLVVYALAKNIQWHELESKGYNFQQFVKDYRRNYSSVLEADLRKSLVESRIKHFIEHNKNPNYSWKLNVNHMLDYTEAELKAMRGLNRFELYNSKAKRDTTVLLEDKPISTVNLPTNVDWRHEGVITKVKNQAACGSCWAFGSTEDIESIWAMATNGDLQVLSEQNVLDCTPNPNHCGGTGGCEGGTVEIAYEQITKTGISLESVYPYKSGSGRDYTCDPSKPKYAKISGYKCLPSNKQDPILAAIANTGPLAINVDASAWSFYGGGIFDGCNQKNPLIDHVVQLVGYGTDSSYGDFWLIRNSWSSGWGESGYIRIKREKTPRCGIDTDPSQGTGCDGGPSQVTVCGTCGILYDACYPTYNSTFPPTYY